MGHFDNQYFLMYKDRLEKQKNVIKNKLNDHQKSIYKESLSGLEKVKEIFCIGILSIHCEKKSIFDEFTDKKNKEIVKYQPTKFILEDSFGQATLVFDKNENYEKYFLTNGQVIGIEGIIEGGLIKVKSITYPNDISINSNNDISINSNRNILNKKSSLFISNIDEKSFDKFIEVLKNFEKENKNIENLFIFNYEMDTFSLRNSLLKIKEIEKIQIFLIPETEDEFQVFPLQPIRHLNLTLNNLFSPFVLENILFLPKIIVKDLLKYSTDFSKNGDEYLKLTKMIIQNKHCCPTAPDTVKCIPFNYDPFLIETDINLIVTTGDEFIYKEDENVSFIQIPNFQKENEAILLKNNLFDKIKI